MDIVCVLRHLKNSWLGLQVKRNMSKKLHVRVLKMLGIAMQIYTSIVH